MHYEIPLSFLHIKNDPDAISSLLFLDGTLYKVNWCRILKLNPNIIYRSPFCTQCQKVILLTILPICQNDELISLRYDD